MTKFLLIRLFAAAAFTASLAPAQEPVLVAQPTPVVTDVPAQTTTTVTTTVPASTTQTTRTTVTDVPVQPAPAVVVPPQPGQHVAEIELVLTHGSVEAYFGRAPRGEKLGLGNLEVRVKLPSTATVTKLASRDKDSEGARKVTAANPWHVVVPFDGPGRYVFNVVEWDDDPAVALALLKIDGVVKFTGHGTADDFSDWAQKSYGEGVHKTGSREIAFEVE